MSCFSDLSGLSVGGEITFDIVNLMEVSFIL